MRDGWTWWLRGWGATAFALSNLVFAIIVGGGWLIGVSFGVTMISAMGVGLLLLWPLWLLLEPMNWAARGRAAALLGEHVPGDPRYQLPRTMKQRILDMGKARTALYVLAHTVWGSLNGALIAAMLGGSIFLLTAPWWTETLTYSTATESLVARLVLALLGAVVLLVVMPISSLLLTYPDRWLVRLLLCATDQQRIELLQSQVTDLTQSRDATVDSVERERRRIERDLHDGPQQLMVSIALDVSMARDSLDSDREFAEEKLERAIQSAKEASRHMRYVARGITSPVLADKGLSAAVTALAGQCSIPVSVTTDIPGRAPERVENVAYFVVSEALTNTMKHSGALSATVDISETRTANTAHLVVTITDDGAGGAMQRDGGGLAGLGDRLSAVDGALTVTSPPGGPTMVQARLTYPLTAATPHRVVEPPCQPGTDRPAQSTPVAGNTPVSEQPVTPSPNQSPTEGNQP